MPILNRSLKGRCPGADILLVASFVEIDAATFKVNMTNHSRQRQFH